MRGGPGALLLDLDGVLFDSEPLHRLAWERCLAERGVSLPPDWYGPMRGQSLLDVAAALAGLAPGFPPAAVAARKSALYRELAAGLPPSPGVAETLRELGARAAVVSAAPREDVLVLLRGSPLEDLMEVVVTGDDVARPKPHPEGYLLALRRLGETAARCAAVEDSEPGVRSAAAAGLRVVAVSPAGPPPPGSTSFRSSPAEAIRAAAAIIVS